MNVAGAGATRAGWIGFALLAVLFGVDFHSDVRERDVFSWMDPYQYYDLANFVLEGRERFSGFDVPSIFPYFLVPLLAVEASVPTALWINFASTLLLLFGVHRLCRELEMQTPSPLAALLVLSSPLLIGLSRSLYLEYTLSALVAVAFLLWLRFLRQRSWSAGLGFGLVFALGLMTKMTFPLFFALPVAAAVIERLVAGRSRETLPLLGATLIPTGLVIVIQSVLFSRSVDYYASLGNTTLPIMHLIGPPEWLTWPSAGFYFGATARTLLFLLTPLLIGAVGLAVAHRHRLAWRDLAGPRAALWLWLIGPLLLLIVLPVKEPRHVAPCAVPAVLLIVLAIEALPSRTLRASGMAVALLLAGVQYGLVTRGGLETPYFLDRSLHWQEIGDAMIGSVDPAAYAQTRGDLRAMHWKFDQNVAIAGFPANEALALAWQLFPAVVFDLETLDDPRHSSGRIPYTTFEDLYLFTALNIYNRRCGWHAYYETLSRDTIVGNAEFVIVLDPGAGSLEDRFPGHALLASVERRDGIVRVLRSREPHSVPYRTLYAREFLARNPGLPEDEALVVAQELLMAAVLAGDDAEVGALLRAFPALRREAPSSRNIHWIGGYGTLVELSRQRLRAGAANRP